MGAWPASIGLIGAGAMGRAFAVGMVRGGPGLAERLLIADAVPAAVEGAIADAGGRPATVAEASACDLVCLAVKPRDAAAVLAEIVATPQPGRVVLSVMAGWDLERLAASAPGTPLVRTMPNLAVRHGAGIVAMATHDLDDARAARVAELLAPLGAVVPLPESLFSAATALAGSGPGLVAVVAEGLEEGAVAAGLTRAQAREMVAAVLGGTAALLADGTDPALLRQRVSSPAGTTIAGVAVLERGAVRAHIADAVLAAARRAEELVPVDKVETYVAALFTVFIVLIFIRILLSFIPMAPSSRATRAFWDFVHQSTDWYLNVFRRMIPPLGMFDLSPMVAIIVLYILRGFVLSMLRILLSDLPPWITVGRDGVVVAVKAVPRSRATRAVGIQDGALRVQIAAPPHQGQSNAALCAYLAGAAGVRPSAVRVRRGSGGARKLIEVDGDPQAVAGRLTAALGTLVSPP